MLRPQGSPLLFICGSKPSFKDYNAPCTVLMSANSGNTVGTPSEPHVALHPKIEIFKIIATQANINII